MVSPKHCVRVLEDFAFKFSFTVKRYRAKLIVPSPISGMQNASHDLFRPVLLKPTERAFHISLIQFYADPFSGESLRCGPCRIAARKRVQHQIAWFCKEFNEELRDSNWHSGRVKSEF